MRTYYSRTLRIISAVTLAFFSWTFLSLWQIPAAWAAQTQESEVSSQKSGGKNQGPGSRIQSSAIAGERFEKALEDIREKVGKAEEKNLKNQDITTEIAEVKKRRAEIDLLDVDLKKEFAATEKKLKDANLPKEILDRHYKFIKHYEDNLAELRANLTGLEQSAKGKGFKESLQKAKAHLEKVKPPKKHVPLDPNKLPHRMVKAKARAPRLKKEEFERDFPTKKKHKNLAADLRGLTQISDAGTIHEPNREFKSATDKHGWIRPITDSPSRLTPSASPIQLAYNEIASDVPFTLHRHLGERTEVRSDFDISPLTPNVSRFTSTTPNAAPILIAQAITDLPTSDDLAETPEVQFTQEIKDIAANLGNNSLRIYEFVRNNFKYEPYYGSLKGAQQTLLEKAGNDFDLASLLLSLYRSAGIPTRYVIGTITMPLSQAQSWLGLEDPKMVGRLLASAGTPVAINYTSGNIRLEHVLVQAWVPYQNGRGALNGPGDTWVYMDPSFKETRVSQILDQTIPTFDQSQYLSQFRSEDPSEYYSALIQDNLNVTEPGRTVYAVERHREIVPLNLGMLVGMPEYDFVTIGANFQEIPNQFRYNITFEVADSESLETSFTYQRSTVELAGKRITLSYSPATANDQSIINNYGDLYSTPAYLINLKPDLRIEGNLIVQGLPIGFGSTQPFTMKFASPNGDADQVVNNAIASAYYAVALDLQTVPQGMVFQRTQKLHATSDIIAGGGTVSQDDYTGELLYATALTYFQKLDAANRNAGEMLKVNDLRSISEAVFSIDVQTSYVFGIPKSADVSGVHIDVDRDMHLPVPVDGNTEMIKEYNLLIGSNSSYFEHSIIEDIYPSEAISAVKGLQLAISQGIQVYTINSENINTIMPALQMRSEIKSDILNAVNAGKVIITPQHEIFVNDWMGVGYIAMNPQTGEAAYIISGGYSGGSSTSISLQTEIKAKATSQNVTLYKEASYIDSAIFRSFSIFPGSDNSLGNAGDLLLMGADEFNITKPISGPAGTKCEGKISSTFFAPHFDIAAPLLEINSDVIDKNLSKNLKVSNMIISSGSSSYNRISVAFVFALDDYIQLLKDANMAPTITSAYRTWYDNCELAKNGCEVKKNCSALNSEHIDGIAADVYVGDPNAEDAWRIANWMFVNGGVGKYSDRVHVDFGGKRRWPKQN